MRKLLVGIEHLLDFVGAVLVAVCLGAVAIQVVMRYVFNDATMWSDTVAACALAWMTFLAATAAIRKDENLAVRFLWSKLGPNARRAVQTLCHLVVLGFSAMLGYSGTKLMAITGSAHVEGLVIEVSWAEVYSVAVITAVPMALFSLEHIVMLWQERPQ